MGFFDLNIPYDASQASKQARAKLVLKSMELGYTGIAYNRTIKGVMSDLDRCSIQPLSGSSLSSILSLSPSFASSVSFHRDLLGVPRSAPFRQYTRLTVLVENPAQGHVLNSGNPVLKTYDLVAVRPLNQAAFDHACQKSEVDIIAIDFGEKLPFRLKLPMIKAAMKRGVHFEIVYSDLIGDVQVRRQMISNAKLLADWTQGKNLIFSSAAPSVNELRGPYDVANLSSLLGLSIERAKAAISINCRNLIINALRKRHFYKEAIRVELISPDKQSESKELTSADWLKWDPLSSEGDLELDDMVKSFSATAKVPNSVKAIDFSSIINGIPPDGQLFTTMKAPVVSVAPIELSETLVELNLHIETEQTSLPNTLHNETCGHGTSQVLQFSSDIPKTSTTTRETGNPSSLFREETRDSSDTNMLTTVIDIDRSDLYSTNWTLASDVNAMSEKDKPIHQMFGLKNKYDAACPADAKVDISPEKVNINAPFIGKCTNPCHSDGDVKLGNSPERLDSSALADRLVVNLHDSDAMIGAQNLDTNEAVMEIDGKDQEEKSVTENDLGEEQLQRSENDTVELREPIPVFLTNRVVNHDTKRGVSKRVQEHQDVDTEIALILHDDLKAKDISSGMNYLPNAEVTMEEQMHKEVSAKSCTLTSFASPPGKSRAKRKAPRQQLLFPLKRLLSPISFKTARKSKRM